MENKYYIPDIESGMRFEVTKEQYEGYIKAVESLLPKLSKKIGVPILYGTGGDINNENLEHFFYARQ